MAIKRTILEPSLPVAREGDEGSGSEDDLAVYDGHGGWPVTVVCSE